MGIRSCTVSFDDGTGIRYSVQVTAETMFEAAALALQIFEDAGTPPGPAAHLEIAAQPPVVNHSVTRPTGEGLADLRREVAEGAGVEIAAAGPPSLKARVKH